MTSLLIVDDEVLVTMELEETLEGLGYAVVGKAHSGNEAMALAASLRPDLALMDIIMPGDQDGIDACAAIQETLGIPVVLITGCGGERALSRAKRIPPYGYVLKPIGTEQLRATIEIALEKKRAENAAGVRRAMEIGAMEEGPGGRPWPVALRVLGPFEILIDGKPVASGRKAGRKPLALLKALIAMGGRKAPANALTDAVWPDAEGDLAHNTFTITLHRLRRMLGAVDALSLREGKLSLNPSLCWLDLWVFDSLCARVEAAWAEGASLDALTQALARQCLTLYRGDFLAMEGDEAFVVAARERLRAKFLRLLERLGRAMEDAGQWDKALDCHSRGLEIDPLAEGLCRRLMRCSLRLGRRAEGLAAFERCRKALAAALGVEPRRETVVLREALLAAAGASEA